MARSSPLTGNGLPFILRRHVCNGPWLHGHINQVGFYLSSSCLFHRWPVMLCCGSAYWIIELLSFFSAFCGLNVPSSIHTDHTVKLWRVQTQTRFETYPHGAYVLKRQESLYCKAEWVQSEYSWGEREPRAAGGMVVLRGWKAGGWEVLVNGYTLSVMRRRSPEDPMYGLVTVVNSTVPSTWNLLRGDLTHFYHTPKQRVTVRWWCVN